MSDFAIETSTIGMVLWNPTNEDFDMQYAGVSLTLKSGEERAMEINCAKHLLNGFGQRGLTSLVYGCDEKTKKSIGDAAIKRNYDFKVKQVVDYNQNNERRQMQKMSYVEPTTHVVQYARELKIKLLEPYAQRDAERGDISNLQQENSQLKGQISDLMGRFDLLMAQLSKKQDAPEAPVEDFECPKCKRVFASQEDLGKHLKSHKG
jgi:hypothetical protein